MFGSRVGLSGRRIQRRHFRLDQIQDGGTISTWIKFKMAAGGNIGKLQMAISATYYAIHCMYVPDHTLPLVSNL